MQGTSTIYSLFGLVVGLGIAEILRGFADSWRAIAGVGRLSAPVRIGWLVPLLGALVIMDQTQFYITAYELRDAVPFTYFSLLSVLAVVGTYFLCSTFVFPDQPDKWPDFDEYYMRSRKIVAGCILAVNLAAFAFELVLVLYGRPFHSVTEPTSAFAVVIALAFLPMIAALIFVRSRRTHLILLILLNLTLVYDAVAPLFGG